MSERREIYVRLVDEDVDVWRPVAAAGVDANVYRIAEQPYDRDAERWEFAPGDLVRCEWVDVDDGSMLAAVAPAGEAGDVA